MSADLRGVAACVIQYYTGAEIVSGRESIMSVVLTVEEIEPAVPVNAAPIMDLAKFMSDHVQAQIEHADSKANILIAANAVLASAVAIQVGTIRSLFDPVAPVTGRISAGLMILMLVALVVSLYFVINVTRPRMDHTKRWSLFYFGQIINYTESDFIDAFMGMTNQDAQQSLLAQVYVKSMIAQRKFTGLRNGIDALAVGFVLWAAAQFIRML